MFHGLFTFVSNARTRTCDDAPHGETFLLPTPARRWPGAGSQTPSSIRCGPIAAQANRKRAARWTTFKARLRLRESTSHRNYRARCAGDLGCTGTLRGRASSSLRHSGSKLPLAQARVPVAKHQRCSGPRGHGYVPDATADALVPARRVVGFQEVAPRAHLGPAAFAGSALSYVDVLQSRKPSRPRSIRAGAEDLLDLI